MSNFIIYSLIIPKMNTFTFSVKQTFSPALCHLSKIHTLMLETNHLYGSWVAIKAIIYLLSRRKKIFFRCHLKYFVLRTPPYVRTTFYNPWDSYIIKYCSWSNRIFLSVFSTLLMIFFFSFNRMGVCSERYDFNNFFRE